VTLATGDIIVISHASPSQSITNHADLTSSSSVVSFNGNDSRGLFKNILIDIIEFLMEEQTILQKM